MVNLVSDPPGSELAVAGDSFAPASGAAVLAPGREAAAGDPMVVSGPAEPRLARNLGALVGGQLATWTMTLLWTLIVPRVLGPVGLGILVSAQSVSGVLGMVLGLGTRNYVVREIVMDPAGAPKLIGTAIVLRTVLAPLVGIAAVLWAHLAHYNHDQAIVLYLITIMTVLNLLAEPMQAALQAMERMKYLAYADIINKSAQSIIGIAIVLVGFKAVGIAADMAIMAGVVVALNIRWARRYTRIDLRTSVARVTDLARQSVSFWALAVFSMMYLWIDTIMLSLMTRSQVVGWYGATTGLFQTLMFLPVLVSTAWLPRLVAAFKDSREELMRAARVPTELVIVISAPITAGTVMVAPLLIHAAYGPAFAHAVPVLIGLALCVPSMYVNIMFAQVLLASRRQSLWTPVMGGAAVVNLLLNLVLIPATDHRYHNGAIGAAISLVITELVMNAVGFIIIGRHVLDRSAAKRCVLAIVASAGMWAVSDVTGRFGTPVSLASGVATFLVLATVLRIVTPQERAYVESKLALLRRRLSRSTA